MWERKIRLQSTAGDGAAGEKVLQMATEGERYVLQDKTRGGFQNFRDSKATRKYRSCQL